MSAAGRVPRRAGAGLLWARASRLVAAAALPRRAANRAGPPTRPTEPSRAVGFGGGGGSLGGTSGAALCARHSDLHQRDRDQGRPRAGP